jgi:copper chaperone CopZ
MKHTYNIEGMTCGNCKAKVTDTLERIEGVQSVEVDLASKSATIDMDKHIPLKTMRNALPDKYTITEKDVDMPTSGFEDMVEKSKLQQLKPLFIILGYITTASVLLHREDWNLGEMMIDFMGLFFIVFSFFKMLDISGFASSFSMYDPIASKVPYYGRMYPFLETILGLMLLFRYQVDIALLATIVLLGITTYGVTKTLLAKRAIKCACLGTALDLPMTEATFIENAIMIVMSVIMLVL